MNGRFALVGVYALSNYPAPALKGRDDPPRLLQHAIRQSPRPRLPL